MKKKKVEMQTHISAVSAQSKRALGEWNTTYTQGALGLYIANLEHLRKWM